MIGLFINARINSTRLKRKHLLNINKKAAIIWLVERLSQGFKEEINNEILKIFLTTSLEKENSLFEKVLNKKKINLFYGSNHNIPLRHLECAKKNNIKYIVSIDGDDILCSIEACKLVINKLKENSKIVKTIGLPLGMNVFGYTFDYLEFSMNNSFYKKLETGWLKVFNKKDFTILKFQPVRNTDKIRMTLDYKEDLLFFRKVINYFGDKIFEIKDNTLISEINNNKWNKINESLNDKYWKNFNKQNKNES